MTKKRVIKVGSRVTVRRPNVNALYSTTYIKGVVQELKPTKRGVRAVVQSKEHPKGQLTVHLSQLV